MPRNLSRGLKKILQAQIAGAIETLDKKNLDIKIEEIPLRNYGAIQAQTRKNQGAKTSTDYSYISCINYQCTLALQLALPWGVSPLEAAENILELLISSSQSLIFQPQILPKGVINLAICDRFLADWLDQIIPQLLTPSQKTTTITQEINYFLLQSTHARCCSLLRLAKKEGLLLSPTKIPWLDAQDKWYLDSQSARKLLNQIVNVIDEFDTNQSFISTGNQQEISIPTSKSNPQQRHKWQKLGTEISLSWQEFERFDRIFGEVCQDDLPLAQARLGLVALTRGVLQEILEEYLGSIAPPEL
ncbi:MAG: hypothetical protein HC916_05600 [Coleofasciculaceae cyanobacterium SM2_1_6]|nr:hypothetical protein [Coleofasciculaceae cyanobacterium SM2_1_6]